VTPRGITTGTGDRETGAGAAAPRRALGDLAARVPVLAHAAERRAQEAGRPVLAWMTAPLPRLEAHRLIGHAATALLDRTVWARPDEGFTLIGLGRAWEFRGTGRGRFPAARDAWKQLCNDGLPPEGIAGQGAAGVGPVLLGGFSFSEEGPSGMEWDGFGASSLVLPRVAVATAAGASWVTVSLVVDPAGASDDAHDARAVLAVLADAVDAADDGTAHAGALVGPGSPHGAMVTDELMTAAEWQALVAGAAGAVRRGDLRKVVVARALRVRGAAFDPAAAIRRLHDGYPTCAVFGVVRGGRWFLGATPERLARVRAGEVHAMALAGSAARGGSEGEDRRLGDALLGSAKDRVEHAIVVDVLRDALREICSSVSVADAPVLLRVSNVQHLHTPITARLRAGATMLDLVGRLHPTPAVGGVPRDAALEWLRRYEGLDRGWYAGPVGWLDRSGGGEFAVAIRSALIGGGEAHLYAGCGIVAESDPEAEYQESKLKLRAMLAALGANGRA
jgi:isochorismate synthase